MKESEVSFILVNKDIPLLWWQKYTLTLQEASQYFGISEKALRRFVKTHKNEDFLICIGSKVLIKRIAFEKYVDKYVSEL